ncbi:MAG: DNA repair protein RecN [Ruminococcaceae bacterium]|nr:DNA repair protein RecN [Oscillospiraceae bacterium]
MLLQLCIKNVALIDELTIEFTDGMNCLTGETGAGKSIIIDAISCILGFRTSKELIKTGCDSAFVEGIFYTDSQNLNEYLEEMGIPAEEDGTLILQRELSLSGRNVCRINGRLAPVSALKQLGSILIDIHGQNDTQAIIKTNEQIGLLDAYGAEEISDIKKEFSVQLKIFKELSASLDNYSGDPKERERIADLYKFQIEEIEAAQLRENEDDELTEERNILVNSEKIAVALNESKNMISSEDYGAASAKDQIGAVISTLSGIAEYSSDYAELLTRVEEISYLLEDVSSDLRRLSDNVIFDKERLELIEERIDTINKLKRKYGETIEEILEYQGKTQEQLDTLLSAEGKVNEILEKLGKYNSKLKEICRKLNAVREKTAKLLAQRVSEELESLEMSNTKFKADIVFYDEKDENGYYKFTSEGLDSVEFLISANPGEPMKSLAKIASGGELSRIMLAVKTILADADKIPTLIFDEIDTGISGKAAKSVALKLQTISDKHQVICVTHHAQIAAAADNNLYISKAYSDNTTRTSVKKLNNDEKIKEVARLLDGDSESEITAVHAKELIAKFRSN